MSARRPIPILLAALLAVGACAGDGGGSGTASPGGSPTADPSPGAATASPSRSSSPPPGEPSSAPPAAGPVLDQAWATAALTDVTTGGPFRITDLVAAGNVVFIEPMAIWCTNCRRQQADAVEALARLDRPNVVWIGLDVDLSERAEDLAAYSEQHGFDFLYAVTNPDLSRALAAEFGDRVLAPPSTPIIVVGTDGTVTLTEFGHKSVDRIVDLAVAHGA